MRTRNEIEESTKPIDLRDIIEVLLDIRGLLLEVIDKPKN